MALALVSHTSRDMCVCVREREAAAALTSNRPCYGYCCYHCLWYWLVFFFFFASAIALNAIATTATCLTIEPSSSSYYSVPYFFPCQANHQTQLLIDSSNISRSVSYRECRSYVKKLVSGLHANGIQVGDAVCLSGFNDVCYSFTFPFSFCFALLFAFLCFSFFFFSSFLLL